MSKEFSLERYEEIITKAQSLNYWFPQVRDFIGHSIPQRKLLLIRHDIDFSVDAALEMAQLEAKLGIQTSYYVRMHCPFYNILDIDTFKKIKAVKDLGHEIGLHYEAMFFEDLNKDPVKGIHGDVQLLESLIGEKIMTISQHNPSLSKIYTELWEEFFDAYQPLLINEMAYFGDSGRRWREGCVINKIGQIDQIHVLIHPYSWVYWHEDWKSNLVDHAECAKNKIDRDMKSTIKMLEAYLLRREILDQERANRYDQMKSAF